MTSPIIRKKDGNIQISVFEKQTNDGKTYYSVVLQRSYKKKDSNEYVNETINLFADDLLRTAKVLESGYETLNNYMQQKRMAQVNVASQRQQQPVDDFNDATPF